MITREGEGEGEREERERKKEEKMKGVRFINTMNGRKKRKKKR